jgi:xylulokinase
MGVSHETMPRVHADLTRDAAQVPAGCDGLRYLPYICGVMNPHWDAHARGAFTGISSSHTRTHFYRAVLEGIAFEQALALEAVEHATGTKVVELVAIGGGAGNALWRTIMADITGRRILMPSTLEASTLGAAIAGAMGAGWYRTFAEAARTMAGGSRTPMPDPARRRSYRPLIEDYRRIYPSLKRI